MGMKTNTTDKVRWADAAPMTTWYYGVVLEKRPEAWIAAMVANCQHHHRTRESAERCGERILKGLPR